MYVNENSKHRFVSSPLYRASDITDIYALVSYRVVSKAHFINRFCEEYDIREKKKFFFAWFRFMIINMTCQE